MREIGSMAHPTLQDVCKLAGTSDATASMILNGNQAHRFRPQTVELVMRAARDLGYVPQHAGRTLRTGKSFNVAVLLNDLSNPFFARYTSLIQRELLVQGYTTIPLETQATTDRENELLTWLLQRNIDGVIDLQGMLGEASEVYDTFARQTPLVIRSASTLPQKVACHVIHVDYERGMAKLAQHMASIGCRHPAVLTVTSHMPGRAAGGGNPEWTKHCLSAFAGAGIPIALEHWYSGGIEHEMDGWYKTCRSLKKNRDHFDCLLVHNAAVLPAAIQGIVETGRQIGRDLALAAFDDPPYLAYLCGGITSLREPVESIAARLVESLLERLTQASQPSLTTNVTTELVIRASTSSLRAAPDPRA